MALEGCVGSKEAPPASDNQVKTLKLLIANYQQSTREPMNDAPYNAFVKRCEQVGIDPKNETAAIAEARRRLQTLMGN